MGYSDVRGKFLELELSRCPDCGKELLDTHPGQVTPLPVLWLYWREILIEQMGNGEYSNPRMLKFLGDYHKSYERYTMDIGYEPVPEEIFTTQELDRWAKENGYVKFY